MAQFNVQKNSMDGNNKTMFETVMVAGGVSAYIPKGNLNTTVDAFGRTILLKIQEGQLVLLCSPKEKKNEQQPTDPQRFGKYS